jgi:hypothetical protein
LGAVLGNLFLGTLLGNLAWEPLPGNLAWEPLPGNPVPNLAPYRFGCSEGSACKRKLFLGTFLGTRFPADLAAPTCSGTFTMAEDPKLTLLGKKRQGLEGKMFLAILQDNFKCKSKNLAKMTKNEGKNEKGSRKNCFWQFSTTILEAKA